MVYRWVYRGVGKGVEVAQRYAGCTEVHGGMFRSAQRWAKVHRCVLKCIEECIGLQRGAQRYVEVYRGYREVCKGAQRGV